MQGTLLIPPDRGTIIGRAVWKPRYVVVGPQKEQTPSLASSISQVLKKDPRGASSKSISKGQSDSDGDYLSIYKSKDDGEPSQQYSMSLIYNCQVQMVAHRKQGPVLPTLVLNVSPDPVADKLRKRRSSRTAGLTSPKDSGPLTLWFRAGDERQSLQDWARYIQSLTQPGIPSGVPMSPVSPLSPIFSNPFSPPQSEIRDFVPRPSSGHASNVRPSLQHQPSSHTKTGRERPITYSESPSLRSRKSDVSSHGSSMHPSAMSFNYTAQSFSAVAPQDLPSPATTVENYQGEFIEGWTAAQGRSSTVSSPIRGRGSIASSQGPNPAHPVLESSSPPIPRETILDRAFQLKQIPGSDRELIPGEEKLTSLARFDALMNEVDAKNKHKEPVTRPTQPATASTWEEDDSTDEAESLRDDYDSDEDDDAYDHGMELGSRGNKRPNSQRALDYIASRHDSVKSTRTSRTTISYHQDYPSSNLNPSSVLRPHTAHSKTRPTVNARTTSQPQFATNSNRDASSATVVRVSEDSSLRPGHEKRHSTSDVKRLSFTEFTKRLSSTSSLLLVQTNQSGSSRGSHDFESTRQVNSRDAFSNPRSAPAPPTNERVREEDSDKRCGWRGSVGVFGNEGGFL